MPGVRLGSSGVGIMFITGEQDGERYEILPTPTGEEIPHLPSPICTTDLQL